MVYYDQATGKETEGGDDDKMGTNEAGRFVCALSEDPEELEMQTRLVLFFSLYTYVKILLVVRRL